MKRYDLRPLKDNFYDRMLELLDKDTKQGENAIFLFEIGDFSPIQKSADAVYEAGHTLMNSLKFNEVDWTIVVKKVKPEPRAVEETEVKSEK
jgi:NADH-quinone oxidoreductase subunit E